MTDEGAADPSFAAGASDPGAGVRPGRPVSTIRVQLALLVMACVLPSLIGLGLLVVHFYARERDQLERDAIQTARALTAAVDRDLAVGANVALALATASSLHTGAIADFQARASRLLGKEFPGFAFVLSDATGQQVMNTLRPLGTPLPRHGNPEQLRRVFETGQPVISDLYIGGVRQHPVVGIDVPVWRDGKVVYDLSVGFLPERLGAILTQQRLPPERVVSIFDTRGVVVARSHAPETYVGRKGAPALVERMREVDEGTLETPTLEGIPVFAAFSRSPTTGWTVAIGIPTATILGELLNSLAVITLIVLALLAAGFGTAWILGGRIGRSVRALTVPALALGAGKPVVPPACAFWEAVEVANALKSVEGMLDRARANAQSQRDELAHAKNEAERASLAKSKFLAAASHDLRQPVQTLVLLLAVLKAQAATPPVSQAVELMENALEGLNGLLSAILDVSRLDAGVVMARMEAVDLGALLARLAREYALLAETKGLRITAAPTTLTARSDPALLERMIRNLIENAIRYTEKGGIALGARRRGTRARIDVVDTGIGIPADKRAQVFEEFYQVGNPARDRNQGLGLGLSIVARLTRLLGGEVSVTSREGRGTRFSLLLPLDQAPAPSPAAAAASGVASGRVLIIEDDDAVRAGLKFLVESWGCEVIAAASGEEALEICAGEGARFDAIICDHRLGSGMTGTGTAREIRDRAGRPIPTLVITGDTAPERIREVHASGFEMMHKPVGPEALRLKLARLLAG